MVPDRSVMMEMLKGVEKCFTPKLARQLNELKTPRKVQKRLDYFGNRANGGILTPAEQPEYDACIDTANVIAILVTVQIGGLSASPNGAGAAMIV